ncbi:hypothetical protein D7B24_001578 [Verticillium nonalfalfae]|uniref:SprT-like domain-containing protein n=1 Tax=Verticillium nonalfalfae TaxID=1051616 RepID=A0A3M9Y0W2_9PEZI|nr:uncharacterized protein D7B24_001578 [Verticillium nonalfalfae]RNJ53672.1 hypothetical protein D7B24_001578 [Verticillium nonalfalfae]
MAFWVVGAEPSPMLPSLGDGPAHGTYLTGGKRRVSHSDGSDNIYDHVPHPKRAKTNSFDPVTGSVRQHGELIPMQNLSFLVIREARSPTPEPARGGQTACSMERTASGLSISSDTTVCTTSAYDDANLLEDDEAAWLVQERLALSHRKAKDSRHERILRSLIRPRSRDAEFSIDNAALESIFSAANEIFFHNRLARRVNWDWSHSSSSQYQDHIIGTTALRRSRLLGGFETLIVLSHPILKNRKYNRRLLISTFLHELIHSYLFVCCGFKARRCGGHTTGFKRIAALIDEWAGPDTLHLKDMEADLDHFKEEEKWDELSNQQSSLLAQSASLPDEYDYLTPYHQHHHHAPHHLTHDYQHQQGPWDYWVADRQEHIPLSRCRTKNEDDEGGKAGHYLDGNNAAQHSFQIVVGTFFVVSGAPLSVSRFNVDAVRAGAVAPVPRHG